MTTLQRTEEGFGFSIAGGKGVPCQGPDKVSVTHSKNV